MQKIERHTRTNERHGAIKVIPAVLSIGMALLALMPFFDVVPFGESTMSLFIGVDIVGAVVLVVAYVLTKKRVEGSVHLSQIGFVALLAIAIGIFLKNPSLAAFFGIHAMPMQSLLPLILFTSVALFAPHLKLTESSMYWFLRTTWLLAPLTLGSVLFTKSGAGTAFIGLYVLMVGALALPLYAMTARAFLATSLVFIFATMLVWLGLDHLPYIVLAPVVILCAWYATRAGIDVYHARRVRSTITHLTNNMAYRTRGVFALAFLVVLTTGYIATYDAPRFSASLIEETQRITKFSTTIQNLTLKGAGFVEVSMIERVRDESLGKVQGGTFLGWISLLGVFGMLAFVWIWLFAAYTAFHAAYNPEYYQKEWYVLVQVGAGAATVGTLAAIFMPVGIGVIMATGTSFVLLSTGVARILPSHMTTFTISKYVLARRMLAFVMVVLVLAVVYDTAHYSRATVAAASGDWEKAYGRAPSAYYLARALAREAAAFRSAIAEDANSESIIAQTRTLTTHIVDARTRYPDNLDIIYLALAHYEFFTAIGIENAVDRSLEIFTLLEAREPQPNAMIIRHARTLLEAHKPKEARALLDEHAASMTQEVLPQYKLLYAYVLMSLQDYTTAADMFNEVLKSGADEVDSVEARLAYALSRVHTDIPAAQKIIDDAVVRYPDQVSVYVYAALVHQIAGNLVATQSMLERGIQRAKNGDIEFLRKLLDELVIQGSITSIGVANMPAPELVVPETATTTATTTTTILQP